MRSRSEVPSAENTAHAAEQAGAADDGGTDREKLVAAACGGLTDAQARRLEDSRDGGEGRRDDEDRDLHTAHADSRELRCLFV
jgi:hypothetical protein